MRALYLGLDTSNYKTSAGLYCPEDGSFRACGKLLEVPLGTLGLRQSDALFQHVKQLPEQAYTVSNGHSAVALTDQKRYMGVAKIVNTDLFHAQFFTAGTHLVMEITFGDREQTIFSLYVILHLDIVCQFVTEEAREFNDALTLGGLRIRNDILTTNTLVGLCDRKRFLSEVQILKSQSQQLAQTDPTPIKRFKAVICLRASIISSAKRRYSSFVQNFISVSLSEPMLPTTLAGFSFRP